MAVEVSGIRLEAQNLSTFLADIGAANAATGSFGTAATTASKGLAAFGIASQQLKIETLTTRIANQGTQLGILQQKLAATVTKYGENSTQAQAARLTIDKLTGSIATNTSNLGLQKNKLDAMIAAEAEAAKETTQLAGGMTILGTSSTKLAVNIELSTRKIGALEQIATGAFRKIGELAVQGFQRAGAAVVGFLGDSLNVAGGFQASINRFASITGPLDKAGLSAEDFSKKFIQLGMDTQFSAQQASDAAAELAKGGVEVGAIMGDATTATLALASAGELQLAPAAAIVAKQLGVWKDQGVSATEVADRLSAAANASTVNVDDLALGLANVGGVAKVAGLSFDETVTALALIAPGFSSAADSGTSFKVLLSQLQPKSDANVRAMKDLGLYTDEAGSAFYDATGSFVGLEKATELLAGATKGLNEEDKSRLLTLAFGQDAQRAAIGLADQGTEGLKRQTDAQAALGGAATQAAKRNTGFKFAMDQLAGSIETAQIVIGSKFLPIGEKLITNFLIPAVNGTMAVADVLEKGLTFAANNAIPIIAGLTAAAIAYFAPMIAAATATTAWGLTLVLAASQAVTAALAFAAVAIPLAAIAISVGAVAFAFVNFNKQAAEGRENVKGLADGYQAAVVALNLWNEASGAAKEQTRAQADETARLKNELDAGIDRYTAWYSFLDSSDSQQRQLAQIQANNAALRDMAPALEAAVKKQQEHERQIVAGAEAYQFLTTATAAQIAQSKLSTEEIEAFNAQMAEIRASGPGVYDGYLQSFVDYTAGVQTSQAEHNTIITGLEEELAAATTETQAQSIQDKIDAANTSYAEQQKTAAIAYGQQAAAQKQHLGEMLIEYTEIQGRMNGVGEAEIKKMTTLLATEYGVQESLSEKTFAAQTVHLDEWAASGGKNSEKVVADLTAASDEAIATQRTIDKLTGEYTVELIQNFDEGTVDVDELAEGIANIPKQVNINVNTNYTTSGAPAQYRPTESFAVGTDRVARDMLAQIHKDEAVLNVADAGIWRNVKDTLRTPGQGRAVEGGSSAPRMFAGDPGTPIGDLIGQRIIGGAASAIQAGQQSLASRLAAVLSSASSSALQSAAAGGLAAGASYVSAFQAAAGGSFAGNVAGAIGSARAGGSVIAPPPSAFQAGGISTTNNNQQTHWNLNTAVQSTAQSVAMQFAQMQALAGA